MSSNSSFINGMDDQFQTLNESGRKCLGENGTVQWTDEGLGDQNLAIFNQSVRGMDQNTLEEMMNKIILKCDECEDCDPKILGGMVADLIVLAFQIRNCRGGKGEKTIFIHMFSLLFKHYPTTMLSLLDLIPHYGYYKDFFILLERIPSPSNCSEQDVQLRDGIIDAIVIQLEKDKEVMKDLLYLKHVGVNTEGTTKTPSVSLLAKYMPRKHGHFAKGDNKWIYQYLKDALFPRNTRSDEHYRKTIVKLTESIKNVPEIKMCAKRYSEIDFAHVPSLCMTKFRKAFLNEKCNERCKGEYEETGNRFPDIEDRVKARRKLITMLNEDKSTKLKGQQLNPHELVSKCCGSSETEQLIFQSQWDSMKEGVLESMETIEAAALNLGKLVPLVDVSGSMSGTPMEVAIALGILVSEVNHPDFRNRFITFESKPRWVTLDETWSLAEKVRHTRKAPWGGSTDLSAALNMIYEVVEAKKLPIEDIPSLIIFSDMQFNQCSRWNETMQQQIERKFADLGRSICGKPYSAPRMIYWNLRSTMGHAVQANTSNTMLLSGFSPSILSLILKGQSMEEKGNGVVTPWDTMRLALDDEKYDVIRNILHNSTEGYLQYYRFDKNVEPDVDHDD